MTEASRMNLKISAGQDEKPLPITRRRMRPPTLEEVMRWVSSLNLDPEIEAIIVKKVKKYPLDCVDRFRERITFHIAEAQRTRDKTDKEKAKE